MADMQEELDNRPLFNRFLDMQLQLPEDLNRQMHLAASALPANLGMPLKGTDRVRDGPRRSTPVSRFLRRRGLPNIDNITNEQAVRLLETHKGTVAPARPHSPPRTLAGNPSRAAVGQKVASFKPSGITEYTPQLSKSKQSPASAFTGAPSEPGPVTMQKSRSLLK
jgi:hypothetical protein